MCVRVFDTKNVNKIDKTDMALVVKQSFGERIHFFLFVFKRNSFEGKGKNVWFGILSENMQWKMNGKTINVKETAKKTF